ncbi:MAG TPA: glycosyltransferase N-terminal domain-containing protein [Syntrophorhabdaceae bacterium]|nr:glycosyltransferase N-terminal domain-containing protein [Syntrophorhabdaceae bacterium]
MWRLIYNAFVTLTLPLFVAFGLTKQKIRKNLFERLVPRASAHPSVRPIWVHGASVGEAMIAENLIQQIIKAAITDEFLITTNTYYTKDLLAKRQGNKSYVAALPLDIIWSVKRFLNQWEPRALLIVETEIWPNLVWEVKRRGLPVIILNGRISDSTLSNYRRIAFFMRTVLSQVDLVLAQSQEHVDRFISIGMDPKRVINAGNIKYFRDIEEKASNNEKENIVTFGSIKEKELHAVYEVTRKIKSAFPGYTVYIAPRELHLTSDIVRDLSPMFRVARHSHLPDRPPPDIDVVVVDTIGDLFGIYARSKIAFVGGSLAPYGGQNLLEPLFFGTPVLFGPFVDNFRNIADRIIEAKAGGMVQDADELAGKLADILHDDNLRREMGERGKLIIKEQRDVMNKTVEYIAAVIKANR